MPLCSTTPSITTRPTDAQCCVPATAPMISRIATIETSGSTGTDLANRAERVIHHEADHDRQRDDLQDAHQHAVDVDGDRRIHVKAREAASQRLRRAWTTH